MDQTHLPISKRKLLETKRLACAPADDRMTHKGLKHRREEEDDVVVEGEHDPEQQRGQRMIRQRETQDHLTLSAFERPQVIGPRGVKLFDKSLPEDHGQFGHILSQSTHYNHGHQSGRHDVLHVVVPINNYVRYNRRYELFEEFCEHMNGLEGIVLYIVEVAFGERPFEVTQAHNPRHLQLRTNTVMWHKENMINQMVERLPRDWKYLAWIDGDVHFHNRHIAFETIHQLQHHDIVQMFQSVSNLGPDGNVISHHEGFCYQYIQNNYVVPNNLTKYKVWHPGFAWACTRKAWNDMGGLMDFAILGAADHHMALALVGSVHQSRPGTISESYKRKLTQWQDRVERTIQRNVGFVKGTIIHGWHGSFKDRKYRERWDILISCAYDPDADIKRDWQGLYTFDKVKPKLRDLLKQYFLQRNEDSTDCVK